MEELWGFFKLYVDEDMFVSSFTASGGMLFWLVLLYSNAIFYMIDFYSLVKRKSTAETFAVLAVPCAVSFVGAAMLTMLVHVPAPERTGRFAQALESGSLNQMLLLAAGIYVILWVISLASQLEVVQRKTFLGNLFREKRRKEEVRRWVLFGIPDYLYAAMIVFFSLWRMVAGQSFFAEGHRLLLWIYLYAIYFLCCKIILLSVALVVRIYSAKITVFKWREGKNPSAFLFRYFLFYQSAMVRNLMLFELGILIPLTAALVGDTKGDDLYEAVGMLGFLWLAAVFVILFSAVPAARALEKFAFWGESRRMKEMFCREYFVEEPLFQNDNYTVTRHFLVDELGACAFYYWPALESVSGWVTDKTGSVRTLRFSDRSYCNISKEEAENLAPVFEYAKQWKESNIAQNNTDMQDSTKMANRPYVNQPWVGSPQKMGNPPKVGSPQKMGSPPKVGMKFEEPGAPESAYGNFVKKLAMIVMVIMMLIAGSVNVKF